MILILREAFLGVTRFDDFMARLPISRAALSSRLRMLSDAGLMQRDPPDAKRAEYRLTPAGYALEGTFLAITQWSSQHLFAGNEPRQDWAVAGD